VTGLVRVDSVPAGATVLVDGQERGKTPTEIADLAVGSHGVRVQLSGYEPGSETVELGADAPTADLRFTLTKAQPTTGSGDIHSTPAGGQLRVDGRPSGTTPRSGLRLRAGTHKLEIVLEGHEPWTGRIEIAAGQVARVDATLKPLPKPTPTPIPEVAVDPSRVYQNDAGDVDVMARRLSGKIEAWPRGVPELRSDDSASVTVLFVVTETGEVQDPKVTQSTGRPQVDEVVLKAVRGFRYSPAQKKGVKVKVRVSFTQTFRAG
jgi:TonB family protein